MEVDAILLLVSYSARYVAVQSILGGIGVWRLNIDPFNAGNIQSY